MAGTTHKGTIWQFCNKKNANYFKLFVGQNPVKISFGKIFYYTDAQSKKFHTIYLLGKQIFSVSKECKAFLLGILVMYGIWFCSCVQKRLAALSASLCHYC